MPDNANSTLVNKLFTLLSIFFFVSAKSQTLYFPPTIGNTWDTLSPVSLGWCQPRIDSLYNYLDARHSKAFIILKDGKIVLERYFGTFTVDSIWYWASASKSLTATLTGSAHQENLLEITQAAAEKQLRNYLAKDEILQGLTKLKAFTVVVVKSKVYMKEII